MAWNEPGGEKRNPWNRPQQSQNDLDDVLRNLQRRLAALFGRGGAARGGGQGAAELRQGPWQHPRADRRRVDRQRRVPGRRPGARRGAALRQVLQTTGPGYNWHLPWPIERKIIVNVSHQYSVRRRRQHAHRRHQSGRGQVRGSVHPARRAQAAVQGARTSRNADAGERERHARGRGPGFARQGAGVRSVDHRSRQVLLQRTLDNYDMGIRIMSVNFTG